MPVNFTNFLSAENFTSEDYFVGYRSNPSPGQEKRWTFKDVGNPPAEDVPDTPPSSGGSDSSFFIMADGSLRFCGKNTNYHGGIGDVKSDVVIIPRPCAFSPSLRPNEKVKKFYQQFTCAYAITTLGNLYGAGSNNQYQLGLGHANAAPVFTRIIKSVNDSLDSSVSLGGDEVEEISTGSGAGCADITVFARTSGGKLYVWGYNGGSKERAGIGNATSAYITTPTYVAPGTNFVEPIIRITGAGRSQNQVHVAIGSNGKVYTIGEGATGAAGSGASGTDFKKFTVPTGLTSINAVSAYSGGEVNNISTWIITSNGDVYGSGKNDDKQVANSAASITYQFNKINGISNVSRIVAHADTSNTTIWALGGSAGQYDKAWCWGDNASGQMGTNDKVSKSTPTTPAFFVNFFASGKTIKDMIVGGDGGKKFTVFIDSNNEVWASGYNRSGTLGIGRTSTDPDRPTFERVLINSNYGKPKKLFGGGNGVSDGNGIAKAYVMCLMDTGKILAWGYDSATVGQLATDTSPSLTPIPSPVYLLL